MKLANGRISILIGQESTTIELRDNDSATTIVMATLNPEQLSSALSRLSNTECEIEVTGVWERIGKKMENDHFVFEIEKGDKGNDKKLVDLCLCALKEVGKGDWIPDNYFGSKNSFWSEDGEGGTKYFARAIIRRWI